MGWEPSPLVQLSQGQCLGASGLMKSNFLSTGFCARKSVAVF